ncbi:nuclear transport factor 2 family protein [Flavisphingomonas formosensis]|uniref:nuclear transport factor 2 family protein n=1 Tax=Flavisphingomonas formosensis TaxID=861534 RepID=UPI0012F7520E|nr:nuclear transport factor 2 family protein [Sphingomonas formosensis]
MGDQADAALLHDLLAREAVRELRARYGWHAARGDYEGIVGLFAPDGLFELTFDGARRALRGREEIRTFLQATMVPGMVFPMIHNDIVTVDGDEAHGSCAMESRSPDGKGGFSGYYHDKARRYDGRWLFSERRWFFYVPVFERSGLGLDGKPETGLAAIHDRKLGQTA